ASLRFVSESLVTYPPPTSLLNSLATLASLIRSARRVGAFALGTADRSIEEPLVSEPRAAATGSSTPLARYDPVAAARGSDTLWVATARASPQPFGSGMILPGLHSPDGSNAARTRSIASISSSEKIRGR